MFQASIRALGIYHSQSNDSNPGLLNFLPEGHLSHYTTVRRQDIFRTEIVLGCATFYQIHTFSQKVMCN